MIAFRYLARHLLLVCAGLVVLVGWTIVWALSYRLTHGADFTYTLLVTQPAVWSWLRELLVLGNTLAPGLELAGGPASLDILTNALVVGFVVAGLGYLAAIALADLGVVTGRGALILVIGFELVYQVVLISMPGLYTTDLFSYVMYGHISAVYELNPYIYAPSYFPGNPLVMWIHPIWQGQPSVYGPLWTALGWLVARASAPFDGSVITLADGEVLQIGLLQQVLAYKALMNVVQLLNLALMWWVLGRVMRGRPRARLAAFVVFAWNPLMLFDVAGNAHNDAIVVTLLLLGLAALVARPRAPANAGWLGATVVIGASALVKYTSGLVAIFAIVAWARRLVTWRARALWLGGTTAVLGGLTLALSLPWLDVPRALQPMLAAAGGRAWMYANWPPDLLALTVADQVLDPSGLSPDASHEVARFWTKLITRAIFAVYLGWEVRRVWRVASQDEQSVLRPVLEASTRAFVVLILLVLTWVLEWYWMWPLAVTTLLGWRHTLTRVVVGYSLTALPIFYVHHYWSWHMPGWLLLVYALPPLALPLFGWVRTWGGSRPRVPLPSTTAWRPGLEAAE